MAVAEKKSQPCVSFSHIILVRVSKSRTQREAGKAIENEYLLSDQTQSRVQSEKVNKNP